MLYIVLGVVVPGAGPGQQGRGRRRHGRAAVARSSPTEAEHGKTLFRQQCASCHSLAAVNARGVTGPNLDDIGEVTPDADPQRDPNGGTGQDRMPAGLLEGEEAAEVAEYVSEVAGK